MRRPLATSLVALGLVGLSVGCSTVTQNGVAASVGDAELGQDELDRLVVASTPGAEQGESVDASADTARQLIQTWIVAEIITADVTAAGGSITDEDRAAATDQLRNQTGPGWDELDPALQELQVGQQSAVNVWLTQVESLSPTEDEVREAYERGPLESGITCTRHILVDTEAEALDVLAELDAGGDFAELAAERSIDPGSAAQGGVLPCSSTNEFRSSYVAEYVDATLAAEIGVPTDPARSEFGYHVIVVRPFDEVVDEGVIDIYRAPQAVFGRVAAAADVTVDPRYGAFDPTRGVVPLG